MTPSHERWIDGAPSLLPRLEAAAGGPGAVTFLLSACSSAERERVTWAQLHDDARATAAAMQARGVSPGTQVALLGPTTRGLVTALQATWLCGAATVVLPLPMRLGSIEEFVVQTRARIQRSEATLLVVDPQLLEFVAPEPGDPPTVSLADLLPGAGRPTAGDYDRPSDDPEALAILQFTSGSTSHPKGVTLPHRCVSANLDAIASAVELDPTSDVGVSWLPLYHDMGLIGLLLAPMTTGMDLALAAPQDFLAAPARWTEWMSEFGGTATAGPNFSYVLATRAMRRQTGLDLRRWRIALNGAEPVDPAAVEAFVAAGAPHGLDAGAAFPAFGMAEATLAVTFPAPGAGLRTDVVDPVVLEHDHYAAPVAESAGGRRLARLGRPVSGLSIRVCDPDTGAVRREREIGEVEILGTSVTPGYWREEEATREAFHDGWLRTGDLGYLVDGELVVCGRIKDVVIVGGRNIHPQDIERAVADVDGVRAGNVIAFGTQGRRGRETVVVVAEARIADDEHDPGDEPRGRDAGLRDTIAGRVYDTIGIPPGEVVLVRPGTLPKTSSGKLQRTLCKARWHEAQLELV